MKQAGKKIFPLAVIEDIRLVGFHAIPRFLPNGSVNNGRDGALDADAPITGAAASPAGEIAYLAGTPAVGACVSLVPKNGDQTVFSHGAPPAAGQTGGRAAMIWA